jgi:hypothetical protein
MADDRGAEIVFRQSKRGVLARTASVAVRVDHAVDHQLRKAGMDAPGHLPDVGVIAEHAVGDAHRLGLALGERIVITDQPVRPWKRSRELGNLPTGCPDLVDGISQADVLFVKRNRRQVDQIADVDNTIGSPAIGDSLQEVDVAAAHAGGMSISNDKHGRHEYSPIAKPRRQHLLPY